MRATFPAVILLGFKALEIVALSINEYPFNPDDTPWCCVTLYEHSHYRGASWEVCGNETDPQDTKTFSVTNQWGVWVSIKDTSSIKFGLFVVEAKIHSKPNFSGDEACIGNSNSTCGDPHVYIGETLDYSTKGSPNLNDKLMSISMTRHHCCSGLQSFADRTDEHEQCYNDIQERECREL